MHGSYHRTRIEKIAPTLEMQSNYRMSIFGATSNAINSIMILNGDYREIS